MRNWIALTILLLFSWPPKAKGAGFSPRPNPWVDFLHKIGRSGTYTADDEGTFALQSIRGSLESEHDADYANLWGPVISGKFFPTRAVLVSEHWRSYRRGDSRDAETVRFCTPQLCRTIDQWDFVLALNGTTKSVQHRYVIEGVDQRSWDSPDRHATTEQGKRELRSLLSFWYAFKP